MVHSQAGVLALTAILLAVSNSLVESQSSGTRSGLTEAIWNDDLATVRRLLAAGEDALKKNEHGVPPNLAPGNGAVVAGNNAALQLLLNKVVLTRKTTVAATGGLPLRR